MVPSSKRIVEDVLRIVKSLKEIVAARGCVVHSVARNGHRWGASQLGAPRIRSNGHVGAQVKNSVMKKFPLHEDALSVEEEIINSYLAGNAGASLPINQDTAQGEPVQQIPTAEVPVHADTLLGDSALDDVSITSTNSTDISVQEQIARM